MVHEQVLVDTHLRELVASKCLDFPLDLGPFVQPASIDMPISGDAYLLKEKVLPFRRKVKDLLPEIVLEHRTLGGEGVVLLKGGCQ